MAGVHNEWQPLSWYCPNCASRLNAYRNAEGMAKAECRKCHSVSVRVAKGRRHNRIDIYAPKGQEAIDDYNRPVKS